MTIVARTENGPFTVQADESHDSFSELFDRYKDRTYDFAVRMLGDRQAAGDVVQDVFLRLHRQRQDQNHIQNVEAWLFIVARNLCLNQLRNQSKLVSLDSLENSPAEATTDPRQSALRQALASLDSPYREAIILKVYQGFSYQEIAGMLGKTTPAVRSILFKARCMLRDRITGKSNRR